MGTHLFGSPCMRLLWRIWRLIIRFRICLMKTTFYDILKVSLRLGEVTRAAQHDKDNGLKFKFQKVVMISLTLQKPSKLQWNEMGITMMLWRFQQTPTLWKASWKFKATFRLISESKIQFQAFLDLEIRFTKKVFTNRKMSSTSYK